AGRPRRRRPASHRIHQHHRGTRAHPADRHLRHPPARLRGRAGRSEHAGPLRSPAARRGGRALQLARRGAARTPPRPLARPPGAAPALVPRGLVVPPTVTLVASKLVRDDIALVPITDLPPLPLGLMWCTARENARIRALAQTAADLADRASRDLRADSPSASE